MSKCTETEDEESEREYRWQIGSGFHPNSVNYHRIPPPTASALWLTNQRPKAFEATQKVITSTTLDMSQERPTPKILDGVGWPMTRYSIRALPLVATCFVLSGPLECSQMKQRQMRVRLESLWEILNCNRWQGHGACIAAHQETYSRLESIRGEISDVVGGAASIPVHYRLIHEGPPPPA